MNILVTGSNGQLGNEIRLLSKQHDEHLYFFTDVHELDITDRAAVHAFVREHAIDIIVNCAAYTNVDKAEEDEPTARLINATAVENLATAGAKVIHVSTDYVFSGESCVPYREQDPVAPRTAYGRTKLEGEQLLLAACPEAIIFRTAWLYSEFGNNFLKTMIRLGKERDKLGVVFDQVGTPTYAADLAVAIFAAIGADDWHPGIYHYTNEGVCSWFDFTLEIHKLYNAQQMLHAFELGQQSPEQTDLILCEVSPIRSEAYQYKTPRPHYSVLDKQHFRDVFALQIPHWTDGVARCMQRLATKKDC